MRVFEEFSHRFGLETLEDRGLLAEVRQALTIPGVGMKRGAAARINNQVRTRLGMQGWVLDPLVNPEYNLSINAMKERVGFTLQTGNIARAFYDLLKFEAMYLNDRIETSVLAVPTLEAGHILGSNIANFTRVKKELHLFRYIITVPCLIIGIDEEGP